MRHSTFLLLLHTISSHELDAVVLACPLRPLLRTFVRTSLLCAARRDATCPDPNLLAAAMAGVSHVFIFILFLGVNSCQVFTFQYFLSIPARIFLTFVMITAAAGDLLDRAGGPCASRARPGVFRFACFFSSGTLCGTDMTFGSFDSICSKTGLPLCSVVGAAHESTGFTKGIVPLCYTRLVELANTMIFQVGNAFIHFGAIIVGLIIIFNVRSKYTAIGRSEMLLFTYSYIGLVISSLVVDCGVSPPASGSYAYFVALQLGLSSFLCAALLFNGIVCFQFWEDGSKRSMWSMRAVCFLWFAVTYIVAIVTFKSWNTLLNANNTTGLFVVAYVINAVILAVYVVSQLILVFVALDLWWYLGAIVLFTFFFVVSQILVYVVSHLICDKTKHYVDGLFFGSLCNLFAVMMVYKFWDMITTEDLEFSVANVEHGVSAFGDNEKRASMFF